MALSPEEIAAGELLTKVNIGAISPANPHGLGQGGQRNYIAVAEALSVFGSGVMREAIAILAAASQILEQTQAAAILIEGGPVSSVQIGNGAPQTGDVHINLDDVSAEVNAQLAQVRAAQAQLEARVSATNAYSLAFGA